MITGIAAKTYNGKEQTQDITVKDGNLVLKQDTDYKVKLALMICPIRFLSLTMLFKYGKKIDVRKRGQTRRNPATQSYRA